MWLIWIALNLILYLYQCRLTLMKYILQNIVVLYIFSKKDRKSKLESDLTFLNTYNCHFFMKSYLMRKKEVCSRKRKVEK